MRKRAGLWLLLLPLLLSGCGALHAPAETADPYAGMVQVESGYGTQMWVKEYEELEVNPFLDPAVYQDYAGTDYRLLPGVDVSEHQGEIDWAKLHGSGVEFAILRAGYRGYGQAGRLREDARFKKNMEGATAAGMQLGVYFFSQAVSPEEAEEEADFLLELLAPYGPSAFALPVFYDWEDISHDEARTDGLDGETVTQCALAFCARIAEAGYRPGVYAYRYLAYYCYELPRLRDAALWIGAINDYPDFYYAHEFWQYGLAENVPGVSGAVDVDVWFRKQAGEE